MKLPQLAATLAAIAAGGRDAFYKGEIAKKIVAFSETNGGYFSLADFADHTDEWVEPVSTNYRGYDVWELPPNGQGIAALQMLNVLEQFDLQVAGAQLGRAPAPVHRGQEAGVRRPGASSMPTRRSASCRSAELISKEYGKKQAARIDMQKAAADVPPGDPKLARGDTIYLTVVDKDRNCCSLIQSNYIGFGSKLVPGDVGFVMQNRGALFALDDTHLNRLEPHKRPFHTIIPAFVTKDGKPWFCFGVMGGDMQPQGHVQMLVNMIDFGMNVQAAGDAARVAHAGSATPTGLPAEGRRHGRGRGGRLRRGGRAAPRQGPQRDAGPRRLRRLSRHPDRLGTRRAARGDGVAEGRRGGGVLKCGIAECGLRSGRRTRIASGGRESEHALLHKHYYRAALARDGGCRILYTGQRYG